MSYELYKSDQIVISQNIDFVNLKSVIAAELEIDELRKNLEI